MNFEQIKNLIDTWDNFERVVFNYIKDMEDNCIMTVDIIEYDGEDEDLIVCYTGREDDMTRTDWTRIPFNTIKHGLER